MTRKSKEIERAGCGYRCCVRVDHDLYRCAEKGDRIAYWEAIGRWWVKRQRGERTRTEDLVLKLEKNNFGRSKK